MNHPVPSELETWPKQYFEPPRTKSAQRVHLLHNGASPPRKMGRTSWIAIVVALLSSMFLFALDNTIVADVQPSIVRTLGDIDHLPWVSVAYALGAIAVTLLVSNLFNAFDNKMLFIIGVITFNAGSALCGASPTMAALVLGRIVCGMGGTVIYIGAMNLLSIMTTEDERPMYLGVAGLSWGMGTILGPVVGGALAASPATWRWCFYLNLIVGAAAAPVYIFLIPAHTPRPEATVFQRLREVDWVGAIINAGATVSLVMGIAFGGGVYAWSSNSIIGLLLAAGILWVVFVVQQTFSILTTPAHRLFPVRYLHSWEMCIFFAQIAAGITVVFIPLYFVPLFFQFVQNQSAFAAAIHMLPLICFQVAGTLLAGALLNKVGYYVVWYVAGGILSLVGGALFLTVTVDTAAAKIYGYSILVGLGGGLYTQAGYPIVQLKVPRKEIPHVVAFLGYGQITGITLALAISSSLFLNEANNRIAAILPDLPREIVQQGITGANSELFATVPDIQRVAVLQAIVEGIRRAYAMVAAAGGLTLILAMFMKRERLQASSTTNKSQSDATEKKSTLVINSTCH